MDSDSLLPPSVSLQLPTIAFSGQTLKPETAKWDEVKTDCLAHIPAYAKSPRSKNTQNQEMDSDSLQLPTIDFSGQTLKPGTSKWYEVKADVRSFVASYDKVPVELNKSVFEAMEEVFELPVETKERNVSSKPFHGYYSLKFYQSLGIDDANVLEKANDFTQQLWPDHGNKSISETIQRFSEKLAELDEMVRRMIMESFGIEKHIDKHLDSTNYLLRMMKYTAAPDEALTNGRLHSPYHRVVLVEKKTTRYSTALFSIPKQGVIIDSPKELVDEEHPRLFKPYEHHAFFNFFHSEAGRRAESALHTFCALSKAKLPRSKNTQNQEMDSDSLLHLSVSLQLPTIDFSGQTLKPGTSKWDEVKADVRKALEDYGSFVASHDKVPLLELNKSVFEAMEELFELPVETKQKNSLGIDDANVLEKVNDFTHQLWPDHGNKSISETVHWFSEKYAKLAEMVRRMIMESFGIEKHIEKHLDSTNYLLRMMKYTAAPDDDDDVQETKIGLPSHTDKNIITILHQYQGDGLEVKTKDGNRIKVKPSQDSFIVMVGDSLCALMNGRLHPPYHRVVVVAKKTRYSTALFSIPKPGVIIDSPKQLVDEEHPRLFKPYDHHDFLNFFYTEAGRRAQSPLHTFCAL
ncbi:unnamed protein product, partial [Thlaspi arvense]